MILYSYWRSSTSYRVRIALNLKGVSLEKRHVDLVKGEQQGEAYLFLNPEGRVPALILDDGTILTQSLAIIDYLDHMIPQPPLLPADPLLRAQVLSAAHTVAMDIAPVNNSMTGKEIQKRYGATPEDVKAWMQHWMVRGFQTLEPIICKQTRFALTDTPSLADICLVPQIYNAHRWGVDMGRFPKLAKLEKDCLQLSAFADAHPDVQSDADGAAQQDGNGKPN